MATPDARKENPETFREEMSDELLKLYEELKEVRTRKLDFSREHIETICATLKRLQTQAQAVGELAKTKMLSGLDYDFSITYAIGDEFIAQRKQKEKEAFEKLELVLLALDGSVPKNCGKIIPLQNAQQESL